MLIYYTTSWVVEGGDYLSTRAGLSVFQSGGWHSCAKISVPVISWSHSSVSCFSRKCRDSTSNWEGDRSSPHPSRFVTHYPFRAHWLLYAHTGNVRINTKARSRNHCCRTKINITYSGGTRWRSWLRHRATSRKVAGSLPDGVLWDFHRHNTSGRTMALVLTQPLTEMSTRNISWGGGGGGVVQSFLSSGGLFGTLGG